MTEMAVRPTQTLVALTPGALPGVQAELMTWCRGQIVTLGAELRDANQNLRQAQKMKWKHRGWLSVVRRLKLRMIYFTKICEAVKAGFVLVPNFAAELIAVRVDSAQARSVGAAYPSQINEAKPDLALPPRRGHYVDEMLPTYTGTHTESDGKGGSVKRFWARTTGDYGQVDFPMLAVKPIVLEATEAAMQLQIFDRIGVAYGANAGGSAARRRSDPIVVGQILDGSKSVPEEHLVTFFIAWWLDPRSL